MLPMQEGAMAERGKNASKEQKQEGRGQGTKGIPGQKHAHQNQERPLAVHARQGEGHQRRS